MLPGFDNRIVPSSFRIVPAGGKKWGRPPNFGLAKALGPEAGGGVDATNSPTLTSPVMTELGIILGTAGYMSPEQAKGRPADKRSDVWAFGCVLYEMLTGRRAFEGDDVADTLAAVLRGEPNSFRTLPFTVSAPVAGGGVSVPWPSVRHRVAAPS